LSGSIGDVDEDDDGMFRQSNFPTFPFIYVPRGCDDDEMMIASNLIIWMKIEACRQGNYITYYY
jgi:hypothetical protein